MKKPLLIATGNAKKRKEMEELTSDMGWEIHTLNEYPDCPEAVEDGETFLENARKKALHYAAFTGLLTLADDSGLAVDALAGLPGVYSARYAHGEGSSDEENLNKVLKEISKIPDAQRQARFICAAAVAAPEKVIFETEQSVEGEITMEPAGEGGFGYDPIFYYPPFGKTLAQVSAEEKHAVSHRGKAMREVAAFLNSLSEFSTG